MNSPSPTVSTTTIVVELENGVVHTFKKIFGKPGIYWESTDPNLNYRKGKKTNHAYKHAVNRMEIYEEEGFEYDIIEQRI